MKTKLTFYLGLFAVFGNLYTFAQQLNDNVCNAELVVVGNSVIGSCDMATVEPGEISPPNIGNDCISDWCDGSMDGTVWYSFQAPSSGDIVISSCSDYTFADTQFALYGTTDCADFGLFSFLAINDDTPSGCSQGSGPYSSEIVYCGLTPGQLYYLQVDGYNGDPNPFEISFTDPGFCPMLAYVQFVHSSPDISVATVDIRINGALVADDLSYGEATPMLMINDIINAYWTINPSNSTDDSNPYMGLSVSLPMLSSFVVPIIGIYDVMNYDISETNGTFGLTGIEVPVSPENMNNQAIAFFDNVTDINGFRYYYDGMDAYGPVYYGNPISDEYLLTNQDFDLYASTNPSHYGRFSIPFENYIGQSIAVITSGFVNPENNSNGEELSMWVVSQDGTVDHFDDQLGLQETASEGLISMYPNPTTDVASVKINIDSNLNDLELRITEITGKVISVLQLSDAEMNDKEIQLDVHSLSSGTYYVSLIGSNYTSVPEALVVNR